MRSNLLDVERSIADLFPKMVPLDAKVLRAIGDLLLSSQQERSVVVFEHTALESGGDSLRKLDAGCDLQKQVTLRENDSKRRAEGRIFGFKCRQSDLSL